MCHMVSSPAATSVSRCPASRAPPPGGGCVRCRRQPCLCVCYLKKMFVTVAAFNTLKDPPSPTFCCCCGLIIHLAAALIFSSGDKCDVLCSRHTRQEGEPTVTHTHRLTHTLGSGVIALLRSFSTSKAHIPGGHPSHPVTVALRRDPRAPTWLTSPQSAGGRRHVALFLLLLLLTHTSLGRDQRCGHTLISPPSHIIRTFFFNQTG